MPTPLTADDFRRLALSLPDVSEGAHHGHPDFRVHGRIFATLQPDLLWGMVKLPKDHQARLLQADAATFVAAAGVWGREGCTLVRLAGVPAATLRDALQSAWETAIQRMPAKRRKAPTRPRAARRPRRPAR